MAVEQLHVQGAHEEPIGLRHGSGEPREVRVGDEPPPEQSGVGVWVAVKRARPAAELAAIRLALEVPKGNRERLICDFTETDDQVSGGRSAPRAVTVSAVFYCLRLLLPEGTPTNDGILRCTEVRTRPSSGTSTSGKSSDAQSAPM